MIIDRFVELQRDKVRSRDDWYVLNAEATRRGEQGGVYRVHAATQQNGEMFRCIPRLLKQDPNGRLYIGKADAFTERFIYLLRALNPDLRGGGHSFQRAYMRRPTVMEAFPIETLRFTLRFSLTPDQTERDELQAYCEEFGELPPFNAMS